MPSNPLTDDRWAQEVTEQITTFVGSVRDKTTNNAIKAARAIVWGVLAGLLGVFLVIIALVGVLRLLQVLLGLLFSEPRAVYVSYLLIGAIFSIAAWYVLKKRRPAS